MKNTSCFLILFLSAFLFVGCSNNAKDKTENRPNIILIMADDLGYGDIGCFGNKFINTPVLDKMAKEGIMLTDFHSNGAVCTPTRAALMTGSYPQRAGLEGVIYAKLDNREYGLHTNGMSIAEYLKAVGYATGVFGKWHLGFKPEFNPINHGFDQFFGYLSGNVDYISHRDGIGLKDWWHNTDTLYESGYVTDLITDHALEFIEKNKDMPFFVYLPHEAPHFPYQGRNDSADRLPGKIFNPLGERTDKNEAYKEMVEIMDENIGRIFEKLKVLGLEKNTIVFFCSDNGATKYGSNGQLKGLKGTLWEGGHRVPAIVWYPKKIKSGTVSGTLMTSMDILPTFVSLASQSLVVDVDGIDCSDLLSNSKNMEERYVFWRHSNQLAVRSGKWKYIKIEDKEYLFNLEDDIEEQNNLIDLFPKITEELKNKINEWKKEMNEYQQQT